MSRLIALLMTASFLVAAPAGADSGPKIHVKSVRQFTPAPGTRTVSETSSTSYTWSRDQTGSYQGSYGPTTKTTYVETTPQIHVAGVKELSQPATSTSTWLIAALCILSFALTLAAFLIGVSIGRRRSVAGRHGRG